MTCVKCSTVIENGAKFCGSCGAVVNEQVESFGSIQSNGYHQAAVAVAPKKMKRKRIGMIIGAVLIIVAVVTGSFHFLNSDDRYYRSKSYCYSEASDEHTAYYRQDGQRLQVVISEEDDETIITNFEYDEDGKLIKMSYTEDLETYITELNYIKQVENQVGIGILEDDGSSIKCIYNNKNKLIEQIIYDNDGEFDKQTVYDNDGYMIEEIDIHHLFDYVYRTVHTYNNGGNLIKRENYTDDILERREEYEYENNILIKSTSYDENSEISGYTVSEKKGNTVKSISYDADDILTGYVINTLDGDNIIESETYNENDELTAYTTIEYDRYGHTIKYITYNPDGKIANYSEYTWSLRS